MACVKMRASERGCEPTVSHQKYFRSNSAAKSADVTIVVSFIGELYHNDAEPASSAAKQSIKLTAIPTR
jgi:hypothetical protein